MNVLTLAINEWLHNIWFKPGNSDLSVDSSGQWFFTGVDGQFMFILWICMISFTLLMVPMFWWTFKYRRRPGVPAQRTPNHNTTLEVTWVVGPLIVVVFIFFWGFHGYMNAQVARTGAQEIVINAKMWNWTATYPNGANSPEAVYFDLKRDGDKVYRGNVAMPVFVVPAGVPVKFRMTSADVIHSFYIPDMRLKMDVFPNRYTSMTFTPIDNLGPDQAGALLTKEGGPTSETNADGSLKIPSRDHFIFCAEYCGQNHSEMAGVLRVVSKADYDKVLAEWGNLEGTLSPVELGKLLYTVRGCNACHTLDGSKGTGPSWKGYYMKPVKFDGEVKGLILDLTKEEDWHNYIIESIKYPSNKIHEGYKGVNMPSYLGQISEVSLNGIAAYIRDLNGMGRTEDKQAPEKQKPAAN